VGHQSSPYFKWLIKTTSRRSNGISMSSDYQCDTAFITFRRVCQVPPHMQIFWMVVEAKSRRQSIKSVQLPFSNLPSSSTEIHLRCTCQDLCLFHVRRWRNPRGVACGSNTGGATSAKTRWLHRRFESSRFPRSHDH
jgi:hypothetical protein